MGNPAYELAEVFRGWRGGVSESIYATRGGDGPDSMELWDAHTRGLQLLMEVRDALAALNRSGKRTEMFTRWVPSWYQALFLPNENWQAGSQGLPLSGDSLAALESVGLMIDLTAELPALDDAKSVSVLASIDDAVTLLLEDSSNVLTESERQLIFRLLESARSVLEEKAITGDVDIHAVIDRLNGALVGVAAKYAGAGNETAAKGMAGIVYRIAMATRAGVHDLAAVAAIADATVTIAQQALGQ